MGDSDTSSCVDLAALAEYNGPSSPSPSEVMRKWDVIAHVINFGHMRMTVKGPKRT